MSTPQDYEAAIKESFKQQVEVEDIFVIPDYTAALKSCGDSDFGCYAKKEQTQLQFTFCAVDICNDYPTGVKVNYRAYCSDEIVEIRNGSNQVYPDLNVYPCRRTVQTFPLGDPEKNIPAGMFDIIKSPF